MKKKSNLSPPLATEIQMSPTTVSNLENLALSNNKKGEESDKNKLCDLEEVEVEQEDSFQDAQSDSIDGLVEGLDALLENLVTLEHSDNASSILPATDSSSVNILSPSEMESSLKVRKKYGLDEEMNSSILNNVDDINLHNLSSKGGHHHSKELAIIYATMQILVRRFLEELVNGGVVENEHPCLAMFIAVIEISLYHGWRGMEKGVGIFSKRLTLWDIIKRVKGGTSSRMALENVRHFSSLKNSAPRIRAWIRLALMNKTLATDLTWLLQNEGYLLSNCYENWSCVRSDVFPRLLALVSSLDPIDFNLYVKEEEIPRGSFAVDWQRLFMGDQINFDRISPPLPRILQLLETPIPKIYHNNTNFATSDEGDGLLMQRLATLNEENLRLRRSLVAQINQRAYFQDEYIKSQANGATTLRNLHALEEERRSLLSKLKEFSALVETHEQTNESLQRQLADAFNSSNIPEEQQNEEFSEMQRLRVAVRQLSNELEQERTAHKFAASQLDNLQQEKDNLEAQSAKQLSDYQTRLADSENTWSSRVKILQEQLQMANTLKDEYKKRLKDSM